VSPEQMDEKKHELAIAASSAMGSNQSFK